eukprot:GEMP01024188.1.p1 GENE.GEMP01024188.1~~GEMP01024188.1.p1  ORF type:complete len:400 (-),score=35.45 GEMP01024188.1:857-2056(-)
MRPILLVAFALCVTAVEKNMLLRVHLDPESDTSLESEPVEDVVSRDRAIIFVSQKSGAQLGRKLMKEYRENIFGFGLQKLRPYDIMDETERNIGLEDACQFLKKDANSNLIVAAAGGDGTVSWVVSLFEKYGKNECENQFFPTGNSGKLKTLNERIFIRHIGFGTGNDFAKSSGYTNEFDLVGGYKKKESTWLGTLKNMNVRREGDSVQHTMWKTTITAEEILSVSSKGTKQIGKEEQVDYTILYVSGPYSGLLPCKVEQHRTASAFRNKMLYALQGNKAFFTKAPHLKDYITLDVDNQHLEKPEGKEFLLLVGETFAGGKHPSTTKEFGDSQLEVLTASGMQDLTLLNVGKKLTHFANGRKTLQMTFDSEKWKGFSKKLGDDKKKTCTLCKMMENVGY